MSKILAVLPLALTMNLGPQIITNITLLTTKNPVKKLLCFLAAALVSSTVITMVAFLLFSLLNTAPKVSSNPSTAQRIADFVFVGLLVILIVRTFLRRKKKEEPRWLSEIEDASPRRVFVIALMLFSFMPTDLVAMITVAGYLARNKLHYYSVFPFIALTMILASLPLISYLLFRRPAQRVMPRVQYWLDTNSWVVNEVVLVFFICMILFT
jgi:hypothetical protein